MSSTLPDFLKPLAEIRLAGRYLLGGTLGEGGMGVVVDAAYPELDQRVAIKFMRPELAANAGISARFLREARLAARVKSPHFVRVYDVGRTDTGVPYLVMEMLAGRDLGDELRTRGPLPIPEAVDYVLQACAGIAEIHAFGVVHRDLKPSNLFLAEAAGTKLVKVLDFGVSKDVENAASHTATNGPVGTPHYMSPEQVRESKSVDGRSDVWAMGVVLYELLTQALPFSPAEGGTGEVFGMILFAKPDRPSIHRSDLPAELEALILRCLERERDDRFPTILEFAEALRPYAAPASLHRIDMVRQALSHRPSAPHSEASSPSLEDAHSPTVPLTPDAKAHASPVAPIGVATPHEVAPTPNNAGAPHATAFTSMTDTKAPGIAQQRAKRRTGWAIVLAAAALFATVVIVVQVRHNPTNGIAPLDTPATALPTTTATSTTTASVTSIAPALPSAADLSTAPLDAGVSTAPMLDASALTSAPGTQVTPGRDPKHRPKPSPTPDPDDLLNDRK